ncbi:MULTISPECIES: lipopolysaccharide biosynthesis protein [unclassified Nostoc]|uniref:lipopolysaccharide biosynthesis protein n=1 Tax=unclassified Nostoc TaxID=2593658 RepID=UPI002AD4F671|nr:MULTISPECIES: lipopolysaccharide biosynthesis protein [unclassified Nostoc]MDZ8122449.1 lipopolysaccharide biosynthesis protein [Nostoc sp. CmiVER01]MDZ8221736.1 lipopolysaccharide biosynthesis protein [Nostoc sp. ChiVER01]
MQSNKDSSNLRQKAVKGVFWSALDSWGRQVITIGVFLVLARLLGPQTFGLIALSTIFLNFLQIFADQGLSQAIVQRQDLEKEHLDTAFWSNLGVNALAAILSIACAGLIADLFKEPQITSIIRWLSLGFIITGFSSVQEAIFQRKLAFKSLAIRSLIAGVVGGIVGVTMAFMGFGVWSLVGQQLANNLAQVLVLWCVSDWRPGFKFSLKHFKELFAFGVNVMGMSLFNFLNRRSDDMLIGYFLGSVALGYYSVAYRLLLNLTQLLTIVVVKVSLPTFSRLQAEPERLRNAFYKGIQFASLITFPGFLATVVLAPEIVVVIFGTKWIPSIPVMQVLNLMGVIYAYFYFNTPLMMAIGKPSWELGLYFLQAITNIIAFAISVKWGIVAVAAAYVIRSYVMAPIDIWVIRKLINIDIGTYLRQGFIPLVGTILMLIAISLVKFFCSTLISPLALLSVSIFVGIIVYVLSIYLIAPKLFWQVVNIAR